VRDVLSLEGLLGNYQYWEVLKIVVAVVVVGSMALSPLWKRLRGKTWLPSLDDGRTNKPYCG